ncbi:MAG: hypothetical protein ABSG22_06935 [Sedimentisphaerales bacterium]
MGGNGLCQPQNQGLPAPFQQDDRDCLEEDVGVKEERPFLYVEVIVFEFVFGFEVVIGANLSKACNARLDGKPNTLQGTVTPDKIRTFGSWPHQTHIAPQDVEQLRKFIEARSAEYFAQTGNSFIIFGSSDRNENFRATRITTSWAVLTHQYYCPLTG